MSSIEMILQAIIVLELFVTNFTFMWNFVLPAFLRIFHSCCLYTYQLSNVIDICLGLLLEIILGQWKIVEGLPKVAYLAKGSHFGINDYLPKLFQIGAGNSNNKRHHEEIMSDDIDFEEHIPDIKRERRSQSPTSTSQPTALEIDNFIGKKQALKIYDQLCYTEGQKIEKNSGQKNS